jgi:hypothetical protein
MKQGTERLSKITDATHESFPSFVKAGDFFTMGNCHQLALALVAAIDGASYIVLYDHADAALGMPRLVHAAAKIGDKVLDIEGFVSESIWTDAWCDLARDPGIAEYEPGELPFEFTSTAHQDFSERVAERLVRYWESEIALALPQARETRPVSSMMFA